MKTHELSGSSLLRGLNTSSTNKNKILEDLDEEVNANEDDEIVGAIHEP
jgi:hypothetical protein